MIVRPWIHLKFNKPGRKTGLVCALCFNDVNDLPIHLQ